MSQSERENANGNLVFICSPNVKYFPFVSFLIPKLTHLGTH